MTDEVDDGHWTGRCVLKLELSKAWLTKPTLRLLLTSCLLASAYCNRKVEACFASVCSSACLGLQADNWYWPRPIKFGCRRRTRRHQNSYGLSIGLTCGR